MTSDGGVNGPVVHRSDLKRLLAIHDTPWTQHAVIEGLLHLYRRSGRDYWLTWAVRLGDAQAARQEPGGRFRWAGHEDDRFSSLVHNALADRALLALADVLRDRSDEPRRRRYLTVVERNVDAYVVAKLYRPALRGFAMNPVDHYAARDRFIVNMNSVAVDALIALDRQRGTARYATLVREVADRILSLQAGSGPCEGGLPYSDVEPDVHVPLYTGLALRGLPALAAATGDGTWADVARGVLQVLDRLRDAETGLWCHQVEHGSLARFPIFVAGAGMIGNGMLDVAAMTGRKVDAHDLAERLLRYQHPSGAIRNFIGYDHPDNGRRHGDGAECWEDVYPTPNWNAQAFHFLCRVIPPPEPPVRPVRRRAWAWSRRYVYVDTPCMSAVMGLSPAPSRIAALYAKRAPYGVVIRGPRAMLRGLRSRVAARRLRIAVVVGAFPRISETFILRQLTGLAERGHRVRVFQFEPGEFAVTTPVIATSLDADADERHQRRRLFGRIAAAIAREPGYGIRLIRHTLRTSGWSWETRGALWRFLPLAGARPDVLHVEFAHEAARSVPLVSVTRARVVVSCRGSDLGVEVFENPSLLGKLKVVFDRADAIHCISEATRHAAVQAGADPSKITVIPPCVDSTRFVPPPANRPGVPECARMRRTAIVTVARLHPDKDIATALHAIRLLIDRGHDIAYTVVGGGALLDALRAEARERGVTERVTFTGAVRHDDVVTLLQQADIFVLTSVSEGFGNAVLEAMSTALPVVVTAAGGLREAVRDGIDGFVVPPRDAVALADRVETLIRDPDLRRRMGAHGREKVVAEFDAAGEVDRYLALYTGI